MLVLCGLLIHKRIYQQLIEAVQRHAASYATNNYSSYASVSEILTHLQWTSLSRSTAKSAVEKIPMP